MRAINRVCGRSKIARRQVIYELIGQKVSVVQNLGFRNLEAYIFT